MSVFISRFPWGRFHSLSSKVAKEVNKRRGKETGTARVRQCRDAFQKD